MDDDKRPRGIIDSFRALVDKVLALLHGRAELFATELEEEVTRLVGVLIWSLVAAFCVIIGVSYLGVLVLLLVPAEYRAWAAAGLGVVFLAIAALGFLSIRGILRAKPRPFDATLTEIAKDRERLRGER